MFLLPKRAASNSSVELKAGTSGCWTGLAGPEATSSMKILAFDKVEFGTVSGMAIGTIVLTDLKPKKSSDSSSDSESRSTTSGGGRLGPGATSSSTRGRFGAFFDNRELGSRTEAALVLFTCFLIGFLGFGSRFRSSALNLDFGTLG